MTHNCTPKFLFLRSWSYRNAVLSYEGSMEKADGPYIFADDGRRVLVAVYIILVP